MKRFEELMAMLLIGLLLGAVSVYLVGAHQMHVLAASAAASQEAEHAQLVKARADFREAVKQSIACQHSMDEIASESTMIEEPSVGVPLGKSLAGRVVESLMAQQRVRWMIPYKVTPFVYGDPAGTKYFFVDRAGVAHEGGVPIRVMQ